jgi:hypothetical protein
MPVNTAAYEILFEFTNDTQDVVHLTGPSGRSVLVERGQDVVLVEFSSEKHVKQADLHRSRC